MRFGSTRDLTAHFVHGGVHTANPDDYVTLCRRWLGAVDGPRAHL
jgi:hypothetical protein